MITKDCKNIRQEIDEAIPGGNLTGKVREHLSACSECRTFEAERQALQGLIAGLETVTAPADFDFRLRARLVREKSDVRNNGGFATLFSIPRPIAIAAVVLLLAVVGVLIKNQLASRPAPPRLAGSSPAAVPGKIEEKKIETANNSTEPNTKLNTLAVTSYEDHRQVANRTGIRGYAPSKRAGEKTATREMALGSATVFGDNQGGNGGVVRIPLDDQVLKVTIDDGRGTPRAVSLPAVSFGSQRLMTSNSFVPVGSAAKRIW